MSAYNANWRKLIISIKEIFGNLSQMAGNEFKIVANLRDLNQ